MCNLNLFSHIYRQKRSSSSCGYVEYNVCVYLQCIIYKSCTPQICHKAWCTMRSVNGANVWTNATTQTSHLVPSPVSGEMNALCDSESSQQGVVLSGCHSEQMLTAAGVALKLEPFCVRMWHHAHPQTCTHTVKSLFFWVKIITYVQDSCISETKITWDWPY